MDKCINFYWEGQIYVWHSVIRLGFFFFSPPSCLYFWSVSTDVYHIRSCMKWPCIFLMGRGRSKEWDNAKLEWKIKTLLERSGSPASGSFHIRNLGIKFPECFPSCQFAWSDPHWKRGWERSRFSYKSFVTNMMKLVAAMIMKIMSTDMKLFSCNSVWANMSFMHSCQRAEKY